MNIDDDKRWAKWATLGGVGFVVLNVVGAILMGSLPTADETNEEVLAWFADKESGIRTAGLLSALSIILLLGWFGSLWRRIADSETRQNLLSELSLIGLWGGGALWGVSMAIYSAVAMRVDDMPAQEARFFYALAGTVLAFSGAFLVVHLVSTNLRALRTGVLPKWNALLGFLPAALFLVSTTSVMTDSNVPMITRGLGFIAWAIWILATSFQMWKTADDNISKRRRALRSP